MGVLMIQLPASVPRKAVKDDGPTAGPMYPRTHVEDLEVLLTPDFGSAQF